MIYFFTQVIFITEYMSSGSLKQFLKKTKKNNKTIKVKVPRQPSLNYSAQTPGAGRKVGPTSRACLWLGVRVPLYA